MLNFIYYPVSAILWFWHKVFGAIPFLGPASGITWALSVVFLVFTLRGLLFKPFVSQVRSMRKMQEFAPEIQKLRAKYGDDRQKQAAEMQKLQAEHGVNPLAGCLPILVQIPVFIGLFHVLKSFNRPFLSPEDNRNIGNYVFSAADVQSFLDAKLFGVPISAHITQAQSQLDRYTGDITRWEIAAVAVPLTLLAGVLTHLTARHSVARQTETQAANPQSAIMNKVMLYLFPLGVVAGGPFFPLAILLYWLANNSWTLMQQRIVYKRIDAEEAEKKEAAVTQKSALGPRPGQKPDRPRRDAQSVENPTASNGLPVVPPLPGIGAEAVPDDVAGPAPAEANGPPMSRNGTADGPSPDGSAVSDAAGQPSRAGSRAGSSRGGSSAAGPRPKKKSNRKRR